MEVLQLKDLAIWHGQLLQLADRYQGTYTHQGDVPRHGYRQNYCKQHFQDQKRTAMIGLFVILKPSID
jgi:hypothetical protein